MPEHPVSPWSSLKSVGQVWERMRVHERVHESVRERVQEGGREEGAERRESGETQCERVRAGGGRERQRKGHAMASGMQVVTGLQATQAVVASGGCEGWVRGVNAWLSRLLRPP